MLFSEICIDFGRNAIIIRDGKGAEDRIVMLPDRSIAPLQNQLEYARILHDLDLGEGLGEVDLPYALARKYPHTASHCSATIQKRLEIKTKHPWVDRVSIILAKSAR